MSVSAKDANSVLQEPPPVVSVCVCIQMETVHACSLIADEC